MGVFIVKNWNIKKKSILSHIHIHWRLLTPGCQKRGLIQNFSVLYSNLVFLTKLHLISSLYENTFRTFLGIFGYLDYLDGTRIFHLLASSKIAKLNWVSSQNNLFVSKINTFFKYFENFVFANFYEKKVLSKERYFWNILKIKYPRVTKKPS